MEKLLDNIVDEDCTCSRFLDRTLTTFKVSGDKTLLICCRCGKKFGEWVSKIYPPNVNYRPSSNIDDLI